MRRTRVGMSASDVRRKIDSCVESNPTATTVDPEVGFDPGFEPRRTNLPRVRTCVRDRACVRVRVRVRAHLRSLIKYRSISDQDLKIIKSKIIKSKIIKFESLSSSNLDHVSVSQYTPPTHVGSTSKSTSRKVIKSPTFVGTFSPPKITPPTPPLFLVHSNPEPKQEPTPESETLVQWIQGSLFPSFESISPSPQSLALAKWAKTNSPRQRKRTIAQQEQVRDELDEILKTNDWSKAKPIHLVELYCLLHKAVYKVDAADLLISINRQACARVVMNMLAEHFNNDIPAMVGFIRWTWEREERLMAWKAKKKLPQTRLHWRRQFGAELLTDYFVSRTSQRGNR